MGLSEERVRYHVLRASLCKSLPEGSSALSIAPFGVRALAGCSGGLFSGTMNENARMT